MSGHVADSLALSPRLVRAYERFMVRMSDEKL
jgi:hypothetical protein